MIGLVRIKKGVSHACLSYCSSFCLMFGDTVYKHDTQCVRQLKVFTNDRGIMISHTDKHDLILTSLSMTEALCLTTLKN